MHIIILSLLFLSLLSQIHTSPTPTPDLPAFFSDPHYFTSAIPSTPVALENIFNLTKLEPPTNNKPKASTTKRSLNLQYILCNVVLNGINQGNYQNFRVQGQLLITSGVPTSATTNGKNPVEIVFLVGNPFGAPFAGALRYTTNHYLYQFIGGSALYHTPLDYAYVSSTSTSVSVTVDPRIAAANSMSAFNDRTVLGGLLSPVFEVAGGGVHITLAQNGGVSGSVAFGGRGYINGAVSSYKAVLSGTVIKKSSVVV